jgi:hypothetical protein
MFITVPMSVPGTKDSVPSFSRYGNRYALSRAQSVVIQVRQEFNETVAVRDQPTMQELVRLLFE